MSSFDERCDREPRSVTRRFFMSGSAVLKGFSIRFSNVQELSGLEADTGLP